MKGNSFCFEPFDVFELTKSNQKNIFCHFHIIKVHAHNKHRLEEEDLLYNKHVLYGTVKEKL